MKFEIVLLGLKQLARIIAYGLLLHVFSGVSVSYSQPTKPKDSISFKTLFPAAPAENKKSSSLYEAGDDIRFVLDRTKDDYALLKFETSDEVWSLKPTIGPRGDEFFKNDAGQVLLRLNSLGGTTLYVNNIREGLAANKISRAANVDPIESGYKGSLKSLAQNQVYKFNPKLMPNLRMEITGALPPYLVADALDRAIDAINTLPEDKVKKRNIKLVRINRGAQAYAIINENTLELGLTPGIGYAGRPSSILIKRAIISN